MFYVSDDTIKLFYDFFLSQICSEYTPECPQITPVFQLLVAEEKG